MDILYRREFSRPPDDTYHKFRKVSLISGIYLETLFFHYVYYLRMSNGYIEMPCLFHAGFYDLLPGDSRWVRKFGIYLA